MQDAEFATGKNHRREFGDMSISFRRQSKCCQLLVASVFLRFRSIAGSEMHFSRRTMGGSAHICFTSAHQVQCYILTHLAPVESRKRKAKAKAQIGNELWIDWAVSIGSKSTTICRHFECVTGFGCFAELSRFERTCWRILSTLCLCCQCHALPGCCKEGVKEHQYSDVE